MHFVFNSHLLPVPDPVYDLAFAGGYPDSNYPNSSDTVKFHDATPIVNIPYTTSRVSAE